MAYNTNRAARVEYVEVVLDMYGENVFLQLSHPSKDRICLGRIPADITQLISRKQKMKRQ